MIDASNETPTSPPRRRRRKTLDIGAAISFCFRDPEWVTKLLVHGVLLLIPFIGTIIMLGWQRDIFNRVRVQDDESLPEIDLGKPLSDGLVPFAATFNVYLPYILVNLAAQLIILGGTFGGLVVGEAADEPGLVVVGMLVSMVGYLLIFLAMIPMYALLPEAQRRGFNGEPLPLLRPGPSIESLGNHGSLYVLACVFAFLFSFLGATGMYLCCVGFFFTMPWAYAATAHCLAQYERIITPTEESPLTDDSATTNAMSEAPSQISESELSGSDTPAAASNVVPESPENEN